MSRHVRTIASHQEKLMFVYVIMLLLQNVYYRGFWYVIQLYHDCHYTYINYQYVIVLYLPYNMLWSMLLCHCCSLFLDRTIDYGCIII